MIDVFLERRFDDEPMTEAIALELGAFAESCLNLYRVTWLESLLSRDGRQMICRFSSPDAESTRVALRQAGAEIDAVWPGTVYDAARPADDDHDMTRVVVTRAFEEPVSVAAVQAKEDAAAHCLDTYRVRYLRTFFSKDGRRMVCVYEAPDAESVRLAQHQAGMPVDQIWGCRLVDPRPA